MSHRRRRDPFTQWVRIEGEIVRRKHILLAKVNRPTTACWSSIWAPARPCRPYVDLAEGKPIAASGTWESSTASRFFLAESVAMLIQH